MSTHSGLFCCSYSHAGRPLGLQILLASVSTGQTPFSGCWTLLSMWNGQLSRPLMLHIWVSGQSLASLAPCVASYPIDSVHWCLVQVVMKDGSHAHLHSVPKLRLSSMQVYS